MSIGVLTRVLVRWYKKHQVDNLKKLKAEAIGTFKMKGSYVLLLCVGILLLGVGGTLLFAQGTTEKALAPAYQAPPPIYTPPSQQQPTYQTPVLPPSQSDSQRQLDELKRQQQQQQWEQEQLRQQQQQEQLRQQEELQRLQDQQKQQMREYYLALAQTYEDMAEAADAQGWAIEKDTSERPYWTDIEQQIKAQEFFELARQYRQKARYYINLAYSQ